MLVTRHFPPNNHWFEPAVKLELHAQSVLTQAQSLEASHPITSTTCSINLPPAMMMKVIQENRVWEVKKRDSDSTIRAREKEKEQI